MAAPGSLFLSYNLLEGPLNGIQRALTSSIGRKVVMGLTGLFLVLFTVVHLSGNLLLYAGFQKYNDYAHALHSTSLIYLAEAGLAVLFVLHLYLAIVLTRQNRAARPEGYEMKRSKRGKTAVTPSAVMFVSGAILLGFLILHLSDFTFLLRLKGPEGEHPADKALRILQDPISGPIYFLGSLILGWHLWHGIQSTFQSLGLRHPRYTPWIRRVGIFLAVVLSLGFASFPVWAFCKKWGWLP